MADAPLDPSKAVEDAQIANILAKLNAGKVLTRAEESRLTEYQEQKAAATSRVADSMAAAASISGLSEKDLARAKAHGCPAFRGSRVYIDELLEWWTENADTLPTGDNELDAINRDIAREKLRKIKHTNAVEEGRYADMTKVTRDVEHFAATTLAEVRRVLEEEAPRLQRGKTEEELLEINRGLVDSICEKVAEKLTTWSQ